MFVLIRRKCSQFYLLRTLFFYVSRTSAIFDPFFNADNHLTIRYCFTNFKIVFFLPPKTVVKHGTLLKTVDVELTLDVLFPFQDLSH